MPKAVRFKENPILTGPDVNGPSLIAAPAWLDRPLGRYYLYYAGHREKVIKLATADRLTGPWKRYEPGVLKLEQTAARGHIASPDIHVDDRARQIRMYFHGPVEGDPEQRTFLATSKDGVTFTASREILGEAYFRVWQWNGWWYAFSNGGRLHRSKDPAAKFEPGHVPFDERPEGRVRHVAVQLDGDELSIFYTRIGQAPERILFTTMRLTPDWTKWRAPEGTVVLQPEVEYEGADLPLAPSKEGPANVRVRQLRDPAIYREAGKTYLVYSVAGESGLAIAELR